MASRVATSKESENRMFTGRNRRNQIEKFLKLLGFGRLATKVFPLSTFVKMAVEYNIQLPVIDFKGFFQTWSNVLFLPINNPNQMANKLVSVVS